MTTHNLQTFLDRSVVMLESAQARRARMRRTRPVRRPQVADGLCREAAAAAPPPAAPEPLAPPAPPPQCQRGRPVHSGIAGFCTRGEQRLRAPPRPPAAAASEVEGVGAEVSVREVATDELASTTLCFGFGGGSSSSRGPSESRASASSSNGWGRDSRMSGPSPPSLPAAAAPPPLSSRRRVPEPLGCPMGKALPLPPSPRSSASACTPREEEASHMASLVETSVGPESVGPFGPCQNGWAGEASIEAVSRSAGEDGGVLPTGEGDCLSSGAIVVSSRSCRVQVVDSSAIPFEERQWTRLPPVTARRDSYDQQLLHFFPCIPTATDKPTAVVPLSTHAARSKIEPPHNWR